MPALLPSTMSESYPAVRRMPHGFLLCLAQEPAVFPELNREETHCWFPLA